MSRSALFIDAGYVLTEGGNALLGHKRRHQIGVKYLGLASWLAEQAQGTWGTIPLIRTYWYDGAPNRQLTPEHQIVAEQRYLSVRLGTLKSGGQKGVDALIYRDMINLARERAITRAYVVSGDEDLFEGVRTIQDMGVQVVLIGVPCRGQTGNQAEILRQEADEVIQITEAQLRPFFFAPGFVALQNQQPTEENAERIGTILGEDWAKRLSADQIAGLAGANLPKPLDAQMLGNARKRLGEAMDAQLATAVRRGFKAAISAAANAT